MTWKNKRPAAAALAAGLLLTLLTALGGSTEAPWAFALLGAAAAAALLYLPVERRKKEQKERKEKLRAEYADIVTLLSLYMEAGLSLRSSWEKIVLDYEKERERGGPRSPACEEMQNSSREMLGGTYEDLVYSRFGRHCGTAEYYRLGGLLEAYVQQGNRELKQLLRAEAAASLEVRLSAVRRRGEKASGYLLAPIMLLFILTLALVMIPAILTVRGAV